MLRRVAFFIWSRLERWSSEYANQCLSRKLGSIGRGCTLKGRIRISGAEKVHLGDNVHIGTGAWIRGEGGLRIGRNTHISRNVTIYTVNHNYLGERIPYDETLIHRPVEIGENVWIGMNVCIAPGTRIGDGAIIGLGTVVAGTVPERAIVTNQKWRIVGYRDEEHYLQRKNSGTFGGPNGVPVFFGDEPCA